MKRPLISIIMGSDSDLLIMSEAAKILEDFAISYELTIVSAHRTPNRLFDYASSVEKKGLKVIIAGAGGAAHLPGMVASISILPVIGVPIQTKTMNGFDSLYSIVQMPPGVPVATMAINGAKNAGIMALEILGTFDATIAQKIKRYKNQLKENVLSKAKSIEKDGYTSYLLEKK